MSSVATYTPDQQRAIEARDYSVALSAGAGCGKTFVLTERFLSELTPPDSGRRQPPGESLADLHEVIAITFTERAAREMRNRIRKNCYERLKAPQVDQEQHWLRLLRNLDAARISTIHSFCGALLRAHAVEAGLDPNFTVVEQAQADTLLAELCEDTLRDVLSESSNSQRSPLINLIAKLNLRRVQEAVVQLIVENKTADFEPWIHCGPAEVVTAWEQLRSTKIMPLLLAQLAQSEAAQSLLEMIGQLGAAPQAVRDRCVPLSQLLSALPESGNPVNDLKLICEYAQVKGISNIKNWPDELFYERYKNSAAELREDAKKVARFAQPCGQNAEADAQAGLHLLALAHTVQTRYAKQKRELGWVDFNDLLVQAHRLLTDPAFAALQQQLASQTRLLLVDECQDTNLLQVELIKALCGSHAHHGKLYFVGDYKQSIYRFLGADPTVFAGLQAETPESGRLKLSRNFRSQPAILDFVNALFCNSLSIRSSTGDRSVQPYQPLTAQRPQATAVPAGEFLWAAGEVEEQTAGTAGQSRQNEADLIARRIRRMVDSSELLVAEKQSDHGYVPRGVQFGDIAILFRALSDVQAYEEALRNCDVPYYLVGGHAFYMQQEIYDVVNLLRALASPADVVSLAGVLRSPMFGLTDETLFWLAQHSQGLAAGLFAERWPQELDEAQQRRAKFAAQTLDHLRSRKDRLPIAALLNEAFALTGYDAALVAEFMGERKLANVRKLLEQARTFDRSGVMGLADFIVQLSQFVASVPHEPLAATHPEKTNVVRLMTVHQAKGLEFPVVFIADLNRRSATTSDLANWHPELGPLVRINPSDKKTDGVTGHDLLRVLDNQEIEAERVRLLYVAATRAADYLVLSGGMNEPSLQSPQGEWAKFVAQRFDLQTGTFCGTLPDTGEYKIPQVKVTTMLPPNAAAIPKKHAWRDLDKLLNRALEMAAVPVSSGMPDSNACLALPVQIDFAAQRRFSVSRLNGLLEPVEEQATALTFLADESDSRPALSGAGIDLGTLMHQALARLDFAGWVATASDHPAKLRDMASRCLESCAGYQAELADAAVEMLIRFAQSPRARELAKAKLVRRELEFLLAWPPRDNAHEKHSTAAKIPRIRNRYLQGFLDCLYQDASGRWHLLDYKTNQVSADTAAALASQFELQLGVYALAVEQILQQPPVELTVHFLRTSVEHQFVPDAAFRQRMIDRVNQAIDSAVMSKATSISAAG
ncbi:MAG TPA: UvrD-helicase domain-containing protein [Pirellulales bacterium]|jgi:ATP-dependent helicase/nuclease subunit A|nr:UvrD-helicase domain-containing protein [Pirellulales bacterium]